MGLFDALKMMMGGSKQPTASSSGMANQTPSPSSTSAPAAGSAQSTAPADTPPQAPATMPVAEPPANNTVSANSSNTDMPSISPEPTEVKAADIAPTIVSPGDPPARAESTPTPVAPAMPDAGMSDLQDEKSKDSTPPSPQA